MAPGPTGQHFWPFSAQLCANSARGFFASGFGVPSLMARIKWVRNFVYGTPRRPRHRLYYPATCDLKDHDNSSAAAKAAVVFYLTMFPSPSSTLLQSQAVPFRPLGLPFLLYPDLSGCAPAEPLMSPPAVAGARGRTLRTVGKTTRNITSHF